MSNDPDYEATQRERRQRHRAIRGQQRADATAAPTCPRCAEIAQHKRDSRAGSGSSVEDGGLWEDRALAAEAEVERLRARLRQRGEA